MARSTRTFVALPIPEPVGRKLLSLQEKLGRVVPGVRWVDAAGFHVTLNFLGDVLDNDLHQVCGSAVDVIRAMDGFDVSVEGVGAFPSPSRPRVIWAGINEGEDALTKLHHDLAKALALVGYRSEEPRFHPHITLGRIKNDRGPTADLTPVVESNRSWAGGTFHAREVIVYASNLGPDGPVYSPLSRSSLRNPTKRSKT